MAIVVKMHNVPKTNGRCEYHIYSGMRLIGSVYYSGERWHINRWPQKQGNYPLFNKLSEVKNHVKDW